MKLDPFLYDFGMAPLERGWLSRWRKAAMGLLAPPESDRDWRLLDVGIGTGANFGLYPPGARITAIDLDSAMVSRARGRAAGQDGRLEVREMDVMHLDLPDESYDAALTTLVFCEVADPAEGLREIGRVLKTGGRLVMLEHTRTGRPFVDRVLEGLTAITRASGEHFDRDTARAVREAGFETVEIRRLGLLIFHLISARKASSRPILRQGGMPEC